ncbi:hypothetical protein [Gracilimonas tropica]|uniref:hypothetical protein n=1 Tax=Gracilimonas tropica TaxID=454600 RepID=UPI0003633F15|nr:hypothetical protein [Gracilimonas tropica]
MKEVCRDVEYKGFSGIIRSAMIAVFIILQFSGHNELTAQEVQSYADKSAATASTLALTATVLPVFAGFSIQNQVGGYLVLSGLVFGPVLGYTYMDESQIGFKYAGRRLLIVGGTIGSVMLICSIGDCSWGLFSNETGSEFGIAMTIIVFGTVTTIIHNLIDSFSIKNRIELHTKKIALSPTYFPEVSVPGIRAVWRF